MLPLLGQNDSYIIQFGKHYADLKAEADKKETPFTEEIILQPNEPNKKNIRLARQQGLFLISSKIDVDYEEIISNYDISEGRILDKDIYVTKKLLLTKILNLIY